MSLKRTFQRRKLHASGYLAARRKKSKQEHVWRLKDEAKYAHFSKDGKKLEAGK